MALLAIDTASRLCAACVWDAGSSRELGRCVEDIGKGHAERLMAVIDAALHGAGIGYPAIDRVAVSVGPGSFTGIRVGVSAARGLALALGVEAVGVTTLSAMAEEARAALPGRRVIAAIDAKRDELYIEDHAPDGTLVAGPMIVTHSQPGVLAHAPPPLLAGSGALPLLRGFEAEGVSVAGTTNETAATADIAIYARLAAAGRIACAPPRPLYLRGPDARPQAGFALPRREA